MLNLYKITAKKKADGSGLTKGEISSIIYHDIFDYPLTIPEMIKWRAGEGSGLLLQGDFDSQNGYFFRDGKEGLIYKRTLRKRISKRKFAIAKKAAGILSLIPSIKLIAVTGSLAMENSVEESDIDFLIITKSGALWTTRLAAYIILRASGIKTRKEGSRNQRDRLCLNMWLDESDLVWPSQDRNIYTAHEIAQILPLANKDHLYEKLLYANNWIAKFWPNAVKIKKQDHKQIIRKASLVEKAAFAIQYAYMKRKITREKITKTRAIFHPQDWSKFVLKRISA